MKSIVLFFSVALFSLNTFALDCHGTEPFWGAQISSEKVTLEGGIYETSPLSVPVNSVSGAAGFTSDFLKVYSNNNGQVAVVTSNKCNNGMSDETFPNEVIIFTGTSTLYGCCGKGTVEAN